MPIGKVISSKVAKNRDGEKKVLLLEVEISEPEDVQTAESIRLAGIDSNPPAESIVFLSDSGETWKIAVAVNDNIESNTAPGEIEVYSSVSGERLAKIRFTADGKLIMNDGGDNAVRYSKLEQAFNQLKADHDGHTHLAGAILDSTAAACTGTTATPLPQSTADIAPAKVDNIEVP
jgi:hypothetical protein